MIRYRPRPPPPNAPRLFQPLPRAFPAAPVRPYAPAYIRYENTAPPRRPDVAALNPPAAWHLRWREIIGSLGGFGAAAIAGPRAVTATNLMTTAFLWAKPLMLSVGASAFAMPVGIAGLVTLGYIGAKYYFKKGVDTAIALGHKVAEGARLAYQSIVQEVKQGIKAVADAVERVHRMIQNGWNQAADFNRAFWSSDFGQDLKEVLSSIAHIVKSVVGGTLYAVRKVLNAIQKVFEIVSKVADAVGRALSILQDAEVRARSFFLRLK